MFCARARTGSAAKARRKESPMIDTTLRMRVPKRLTIPRGRYVKSATDMQ